MDYIGRVSSYDVRVRFYDYVSSSDTYGLNYTLLDTGNNITSFKYSDTSWIGVEYISDFAVEAYNFTYGDCTITETYSVTSYSMYLDEDLVGVYGGTSSIYHNEYELWYASSIIEDIFGTTYSSSQLYSLFQPYYSAKAWILYVQLKGETSGRTISKQIYFDIDFSSLALKSVSLDNSSITI